MSKITKIQSCTVRVPLENPTSFSTRRVLARDYALVRIETDDGAHGIGFCYGGSSGGAVVTRAVRDLLAPGLIGEDPYRVEGLWQKLYQESILHGRTGSVMRALSILDNALWDRNSRAAGLPLYKYLGCARTGTVPAYASGGYYLDGKTPEKLGEECAGYVAQGFTAVKIKVGRFDIKREEAWIAGARDAVGPDVILMLDANNAWADLTTAMRFVDMYADYDPYWIEEPFSPDDIDNHAKLAQRTHIPVATGEIEAGRWRFKELLDKDAAQILQTDACVCGGITEWRRIAAIASGYGVPVFPHWFHDLHAHLVAAAPNASMVEFFPDDQVLNFRRLIDRQIEFRGGELVLPEGAGLGFDFDEAAVKKYAIEAWG